MDGSELAWFLAATIGPAAAISFLLGFIVRRLAPRWGLLDRPGGRKDHAAATPMGGGIAIALATAAPLAVTAILGGVLFSGNAPWLPQPLEDLLIRGQTGIASKLDELGFFFAAAMALLLLGLADDKWRLDWRLRLAVQFAVAGACVFGQGWQLTLFLDWPAVTKLLSVLWIVAIVNAFNMLDNMNGLSAGVAAIAAALLAAVMLSTPDPAGANSAGAEPQYFVAGVAAILCGSLLGFLYHNFPAGRLFMGDAGSYFIGFTMAICTLLADFTSYQSGVRHAVLAPLCLLAIPLYDLTSVVFLRIREGRSPFAADRRHFSHRLVDAGLSRPAAVIVIWLISAACGAGALLLYQVDFRGALCVLTAELLVLLCIAAMEWRSQGRKGR